ncbi:Sodium/hydrogen exchanger family-domain-containing protein [Aspergillus bertholletiae]|uniref:Sodium/hydrogen exchanger family-domain-containing protein n=1 Tax=Aspergillus bertholletiae TaxID=1226010 RepID=A0A5N7AWB8_9EURO|nr:Sodium/hydrogen exchanger family-domain-containing protein [Aspergillus bertholletiae]
MSISETAFAYHEPTISTILNLAGFLLVLNLVNMCLDKLVYCGLLGQLFIGILWGTPGAKWLTRDMETVMQQLGYLGLIMLVYEGGISTSLPSLKANILLSLAVATTGIGVSMGLSFILTELVAATPLQAFSAGAALSATSLGTTFTILSTTNLIKTRLGTVTTGAAMLDDVVGLVLVQVITNLGGSGESFRAMTVIRPVCVSIGFGTGVWLLCRWGIQPVLQAIRAHEQRFPAFTGTIQFYFLVYTFLLVGMVAGATYADASSLFAAYIAGVVTSWIDGFSKGNSTTADTGTMSTELSTQHTYQEEGSNPQEKDFIRNNQTIVQQTASEKHKTPPTGSLVYEKYYHEPVTRILVPFFFASIGFAIPITEMFHGKIVWRGVVYALLMVAGKLVTGLWLVRFSSRPFSSVVRILRKPFSNVVLFCARLETGSQKRQKETPETQLQQQQNEKEEKTSKIQNQLQEKQTSSQPDKQDQEQEHEAATNSEPPTQQPRQATPNSQPTSTLPPKPKSLYPASILGLAMVSRGEVGYLIASLAESKGMFGASSRGDSSETYMVIVWAISLCTLFGPICVGTLVKRVKSLQRMRVDRGGEDPLGVWGI